MAIKFPKKQEQRLIPKYLLEYSEELAKNHPDPSAEWGGSGVADIEAGTGINITGETTKTISVDDETVAMVANLAPVAFSGSYSELSNKPDLSVYELKEDAFSGDYDDLTNKPSIPTKTSDLTNDSNFIPSSAANTKTYIIRYTAPYGNVWSRADYESNCIGFENQNGSSALYFPENKTGTIAVTNDIPTKVSDLTNDAGYLTAVTWNQVTGKPTFATVATTGSYNDLSNKPDLTVYELKADAFSGSYNDLTDKPTLFSGDYDDLTNKPDLSVYELKSEAFSGSYNDLTDKPTIPTVGNGTITIKKNNTTVSTFTTNQSTNKSINITVPTDTSDLTNGAGFITAAQVPAGWEVVDVYQTHGDTPISAADLAKLAGDNVCIRYNLDAIAQGAYDLFYKKGSPVLYNGYEFDNFSLNYHIGTSYIGFGQIYVNATTGVWSYTEDNRAYAGHKIESGSGLVEGSTTTSYGKTLAVDTSVVALRTDIPRVGDATITIQKNGTTVDTFNANQSTNKSINITVPTTTSDLNNDSGFITGITSSDVTTALGYTPGTSNFSGDYDDLTNKPTIPTVDYPVTDVQVNGTSVLNNKVAELTSGTQYEHIVTVMNTNSISTATARCVAKIVTSSATPFTLSTLTTWLLNNSHVTTSDGIYEASGAFYTNNASLPVMGIRAYGGNTEIIVPRSANNYYVEQAAGIIDNINTNDVLVQIQTPHVPTYTTLFSVTPTSGVTTYNINLTDDITKYDEIKVYFNANDDIVQRWCQTFPDPAVNNKINLTSFGNGTTRLYTKNTLFNIATTTSLALVNSAQQRVGNNETTTVGVSTTQFHCRPYKIIGIKY